MRDMRNKLTKIFCLLALTALTLAPQSQGQQLQFGDTTQFFPQFALGAGWTTTITVFNPTAASEKVTVEMYREDGSTLVRREVSLAPSETQNVQVDAGCSSQ